MSIKFVHTTNSTAGIGPVPIIFGSTPDSASAIILAMGFIPFRCATILDINTTAAAPSFIPDAFPAVTVPSTFKDMSQSKMNCTLINFKNYTLGNFTFLNTGRSLLRLFVVVPGLGNSSFEKTLVSFLIDIVTGTISLSKYPLAIAVSALCCDSAAYSSCSSRVILNSSAIFSAAKKTFFFFEFNIIIF